MNTGDLDRLMQLMLERGFSRIDISDGRQRVVMKLPISSGAASPVAYAQPACARVCPAELRSPSIGTLLSCHPMHTTGGEGFAEGSRVVAGEPVAYVRAGNLLSVVVAPTDGRLGRRLCELGHLAGYATPVFEFFPDEDGKAAKG